MEFKHDWKFYAEYAKDFKEDRTIYADDKKKKKIEEFKKEYGFDYTDSWNLDTSIILFVLPRVAYLREHFISAPSEFLEEPNSIKIDVKKNDIKQACEKWAAILDVITRGFYLYLKKDESWKTKEEKETWEQAFEYFTKYFRYLWD